MKAHLTTLFERLGVRNRAQAGVLLHSLELADPASAAGARTTRTGARFRHRATGDAGVPAPPSTLAG